MLAAMKRNSASPPEVEHFNLLACSHITIFSEFSHTDEFNSVFLGAHARLFLVSLLQTAGQHTCGSPAARPRVPTEAGRGASAALIGYQQQIAKRWDVAAIQEPLF